MATIKEILDGLNVIELRKLAKKNKIKLVTSGIFFGGARATRKDDIIEILLDSGKITKKKIEEIKKPPKPKKTSIKRKQLRAGEKTQILKRQKYKCARCKKVDLSKTVPHFDHKKPLALGGSDTLRNIQGLCGTCHAEKTQEDRLKISKERARKR